MVRSRFPGKPAKSFHRKKVSSAAQQQHYEGSTAAQEIYHRLNLFKAVFGSRDEVSSFHGFTPHEVESAAVKANSNYRCLKKELKDGGLDVHPSIEPLSVGIVRATVRKQLQCSPVSVDSSHASIHNHDDIKQTNKVTINVATLSGKFVLPTRSAHSSRVIKPNKRFIQSDSPVCLSTGVPPKKPRLPSATATTTANNNDNTCIAELDSISEQLCTDINSSQQDPQMEKHQSIQSNHKKHKRMNPITQSPVKVILRKPRLNIKSESYLTVEGPFSTSSATSLGSQGTRKQHQVPAKVVCGVCGSVRLYKFLKQARKFGIFSCEPCRRFILKILKMERQKTLQPLQCNTGNGTCRIRHSALESNQTFSTEWSQKKFHGDGPRRCQGCWLNLCLSSFNMPHDLYSRLTSYLPDVFAKKPVSAFETVTGGKWGDTEVIGLRSLCSSSAALTCIAPTRSLTCEVAKSIKKRATAIARRDPPPQLGPNFTALGQGVSRDVKDVKRMKVRQKLAVSGPRVKHVCRSASLVLGQTPATFVSVLNKNSSSDTKKLRSEDIVPVRHQTRLVEREESVNVSSTKTQKMETEATAAPQEELVVKQKTESSSGPPIARMLQDLGRVNWELLDGIEKQESELLHAKVSIDFWESYDPEEVTQTGFSLLGYGKFRLRALCFLCGSAGYDKLVHCACCCEPYHTYCVSNLRFVNKSKDWWKVDWLCPKCTHCVSCGKSGGTQLTCAKCYKSYHSACISTARSNMTDNNWLCPSCLCCKSCNNTSVHVFVGNLPLCKPCFKLRKKGSFCPLCQRCYDDNDYSTKMMECAQCKSWIHAKCEGLSNEKYQVLSYLPSSIEFVCRLCCKEPPALWSLAIDSELKAGYLNVLKALSKNRNACALLKSSPKKQPVCSCQDIHSTPIHLPHLTSDQPAVSASIAKEKDLLTSASALDDKNSSDFGLLTPKMTKDDEESMKTVKSGFLNLVNIKDSPSDKDRSKYHLRDSSLKNVSEDMTKDGECDPQLLSIAYHTMDGKGSQLSPQAMSQTDSGIASADDEQKSSSDDRIDIRNQQTIENKTDTSCHCGKHTTSKVPLNLMSVKNKASCDEYSSLLQFHQDMEQVINSMKTGDLLKIYHKALKQVFPWFDPKESQICESLQDKIDIPVDILPKEYKKLDEYETQLKKNCASRVNNFFEGLLDRDQDYYYSGLKINDTRICMLCKSSGEGLPTREERLLYCGNNEWVHANCALWSSEVFEEIDGSLQNVHSAISRARLIRCYGCSKKGASIGCCARSCPVAYHFNCALSANCIFLENKEVYCKNHRHLTESKELHKEKDFPISRSIYVELDHRKRKDVPRHQVKLIIGSLYVEDFGTIVPEFSDREDLIIPCDFKCTRLYWSCVEPWKIVQYHLKTCVTQSSSEYCSESDINYTVDHSLDFTPPPSPVETAHLTNNHISRRVEEKDVRCVIGHILDAICSREEDTNLSDQQAADLLPPELKDAIFEELPHDLLDGISVNDIFPKMMNFDDVTSLEIKSERAESYPDSDNLNADLSSRKQRPLDDEESVPKTPSSISLTKNNINSSFRSQAPNSNPPYLNAFCKLKTKESSEKRGVDTNDAVSEVGKENKWKRKGILQVDGTIDCSESEHSNDSCDLGSAVRSDLVQETPVSNSNLLLYPAVNVETNNCLMEDKPVKCGRCHRTYRTSVGYNRHLSTCNSDYLSCSESDSSEEEKSSPSSQNITAIIQHNPTTILTNGNQISMSEISSPPPNTNCCNMTTQTSDVSPGIGNLHVCGRPLAANNLAVSTDLLLSDKQVKVDVRAHNNVLFASDNKQPSSPVKRQRSLKTCNPKKSTKAPQMLHSVVSNGVLEQQIMQAPHHHQPLVEIQSANMGPSGTIILQPAALHADNVTAYIDSFHQHHHQPNIHYLATTALDSQEKSQYLAQDQMVVPGTFHIQSAPSLANVPTVLGTIIQPNGVEQIIVNNPNPPLEVYTAAPQQNSLFITNSPLYVGMETVVSNTVMSSSQFISSSIPGMLAASSYSATTTQVFQATKPIIPQGYVVVNTHQPLIENAATPTCIPQIFSNPPPPPPAPISQQPVPWTANYQVNFQEASYKMDKSTTAASYQTVTRQIIHEAKEIDGVKMINSTQETIVIEPVVSAQPKITEIKNDPPNKTDEPVKELSKLVNQFSSTTNTTGTMVGSDRSSHNSQVKQNLIKLVELPNSSAIDKEKPQQAVAPVVVKKMDCLSKVPKQYASLLQPEVKQNTLQQVIHNKKENCENLVALHNGKSAAKSNKSVACPTIIRKEMKQVLVTPHKPKKIEPKRIVKPVMKNSKNSGSVPTLFQQHTTKEQFKKKVTPMREEPKITYEITSEDGFSYTTTDVLEAWEKVFQTVQIARQGKGLPPLSHNPFSTPDSMLKKMMGLGNKSMKYILEQLPGIGRCIKYTSVYHKKELSALDHELSRATAENASGSARTEPYNTRHKYDMFSWLASRHRRPPKLLNSDNDLNINRRATSSNLPMAMRFRHLKETSKQAVGVFRSDIHGRGLFCLRDIEAGEMVIEYAGEVIRSALTDLRERYYTAKGIGCYMFRIDDKFVVDATMKGNAARFINHSCEPNCYSRVVDILGKKHILIFALRRIPQGEELTYDYKFPLEEEKINCHCLSRKCRKYLN